MKPWIAICFGKDCRKRKKDIERLKEALDGTVDIRVAKCMKICKKSPIVVIDRGDGEFCLDRIRGKELQQDLNDYLNGKPASTLLWARRRKQKKKNIYSKSTSLKRPKTKP